MRTSYQNPRKLQLFSHLKVLLYRYIILIYAIICVIILIFIPYMVWMVFLFTFKIPYMVWYVSLLGSIETAVLRLIARASTTDLHIQIAQCSNDPKQVILMYC